MTKKVKLTTRGRYAVMAMVELAQSEKQKPVPLSDIAERGDISLSYLEQLIAGLRRHGLVRSYRGPGGGYVLAKTVDEIMVSDILIAAEDSTPAKKKRASSKKEKSPQTQNLWSHIEEFLYGHLKDISLSDMMNGKLPKV
jgi:Rrf2 family iron-sulfur cluster assembly transcriptional regulator